LVVEGEAKCAARGREMRKKSDVTAPATDQQGRNWRREREREKYLESRRSKRWFLKACSLLCR
jgi:hypothetical protein